MKHYVEKRPISEESQRLAQRNMPSKQVFSRSFSMENATTERSRF
jgi:hypothetical protein